MPSTGLQLRRQTRHCATILALVGMALGLGACLSNGAGDRLGAPVQAFSTNAFRVTLPTLVSRADGLHVLGAVCRRRQDVVRRQVVRVEHVDRAGRLTDATSVKLGSLDERPIHCVFYDALTAWRLGPGDAILVCLDQGAPGRTTEAVCRAAS